MQNINKKLILIQVILALILIQLYSGCYISKKKNNNDAGTDDINLQDYNPLIPDASSTEDRENPWPSWDASVCDNVDQPTTQLECELFTNIGCQPGFACYNSIYYPTDPCQQEIYITYCSPPGEGVQGEPCDFGCYSGYNCFVTGQGTQCLLLCNIFGGDPDCPPGLICNATDMPGVGACL